MKESDDWFKRQMDIAADAINDRPDWLKPDWMKSNTVQKDRDVAHSAPNTSDTNIQSQPSDKDTLLPYP